MATQWYFQSGGEERGPVPFRQLMGLVQAGSLTESDLVRSSWKTEWQPANSVVGLFYMAGRSAEELARLSAASDAEPAAESAAAGSSDEVAIQGDGETADDRAAWMERLDEITVFREAKPGDDPGVDRRVAERLGDKPRPAEVSGSAGDQLIVEADVSTAVVGGPRAPMIAMSTAVTTSRAESAWSSSVDSALVAVDARQAGAGEITSPGRVVRLLDRIGRIVPRSDRAKAQLRIGFRIVCAIICAALVANAVENYSRREDLRFPDYKPPPGYKAIGRYYFPVVGKCKRRNYLYLISGLTLATAAGAYFAAAWLESRAD
jgi:hypothetical protein